MNFWTFCTGPVQKIDANGSQNRPKKRDFRIIELELDILRAPQAGKHQKKPVFYGLFAFLNFRTENGTVQKLVQLIHIPQIYKISILRISSKLP
jgi:hypothetical protein